jgi:hypothetical protein
MKASRLLFGLPPPATSCLVVVIATKLAGAAWTAPQEPHLGHLDDILINFDWPEVLASLMLVSLSVRPALEFSVATSYQGAICGCFSKSGVLDHRRYDLNIYLDAEQEI